LGQKLGTCLDEIQHPPLVTRFRLPGGWSFPLGIFFSSRGCSFRCTFCQTTAFAPKPKEISLACLDRVLHFYVQHRIHFVLLLDENFGNLPSHADAVIELLARHRVRWLVQSRVDLLLRNFNDWRRCGMEGALLCIESFHQDILKQMHKNEKAQAAFELAQRLDRAGLYAQGYYIIVWNHPHCAPGVLESLLEQGFHACYGKNWLVRRTKKFLSMRRAQKDISSVLLGPVRSRWPPRPACPIL